MNATAKSGANAQVRVHEARFAVGVRGVLVSKIVISIVSSDRKVIFSPR
jgi:hypothetical protein